MEMTKGAFVPILALIVILSLVSCSAGYTVAPEDQLSNIYEESVPSVVGVVVDITPPGFGSFSRGGQSVGTGFVWDLEGHIVTNAHVVESSDDYGERILVDRIAVIFFDGSDFDAEVIGIDHVSDLAVLKVNTPAEKFKPLILGDSDSLRVGQLAVVIGHPFGFEFSVTSGIISGVARPIYNWGLRLPIPGGAIQTDASINPGNSSGPLLDSSGHVIGINEQVYSEDGTSSGVGFAIPINTAKRIVPDLIEKGSHDYPWVGMTYRYIATSWAAEEAGFSADTRGAVIVSVTEGSPAEEAGFLAGDMVMAVDGKSISGSTNLVQNVILHGPGDKAVFDVVRDAEPVRIEVTLGKYKADVFRR